jgi:hypothetical protein
VSTLVTYLPRSLGFGIPDRGDRYLILIKKGADQYFLLEGTNRVYRLARSKENGLPELVRIDRTTHEGDNYLMMAFQRKDTIYQVGGYGFWRMRNFFTYYLPSLQEWEYAEGWKGIEAMNTWNYFDARADKLYVIGRHSKNHQLGKQLTIEDSIYCFDFAHKEFQTIGKITGIDWRNEFKTSLGTATATPAGLFFLWAKEIRLVDMGKNKIFRITNAKRDSVNLAIQQFSEYPGQGQVSIYLKDTFYLVSEDDKGCQVQKIPLTLSHFDTSTGTALYISAQTVRSTEIPVGFQSWLYLPGTFLLVVVSAMLAYRQGRKSTLNSNRIPPRETNTITSFTPQDTPANHEPSDHISDLSFFLTQLSLVEQELLKEISRLSLQDKKVETDTINKILGVSNKDPEVQKARRSNAITHINNTYTQTTRRNGVLIQRERDQADKRAYVYYIPDEMARILINKVQEG